MPTCQIPTASSYCRPGCRAVSVACCWVGAQGASLCLALRRDPDAIAAFAGLHNPLRGVQWCAQALEDYTSIVQRHASLAVTEYARLSRALMLFQTERPADAILQLDDLRVSMLGCACQLWRC